MLISDVDGTKFKISTNTVENLSLVLNKIEKITLKGRNIESLDEIVRISNPIYKN